MDALELRLTADEGRRLADRPIVNVHAYECYLRARQEAWRWREDAIDHAIQLLQNGLAIVGDNAGLYAALGHAYLQYREAGIDLSERPLDEAEGCARKVFALEPASASGLQLRGWIHGGRGLSREQLSSVSSSAPSRPSRRSTPVPSYEHHRCYTDAVLPAGGLLDRNAVKVALRGAAIEGVDIR